MHRYELYIFLDTESRENPKSGVKIGVFKVFKELAYNLFYDIMWYSGGGAWVYESGSGSGSGDDSGGNDGSGDVVAAAVQ